MAYKYHFESPPNTSSAASRCSKQLELLCQLGQRFDISRKAMSSAVVLTRDEDDALERELDYRTRRGHFNQALRKVTLGQCFIDVGHGSTAAKIKASIPFLLIQCVGALRAEGLDQVGLFRREGNDSRVRRLEVHLASNDFLPYPDYESSSEDLATVLKRLLKSIPGTLLGERIQPLVWKIVRSATRDDAEKRRILSLLCSSLPTINLHSLLFLAQFLNEVARHSNVNLMDAANLAMSLCPSIFPLPQSVKQSDLLEETGVRTSFLQALITDPTLLLVGAGTPIVVAMHADQPDGICEPTPQIPTAMFPSVKYAGQIFTFHAATPRRQVFGRFRQRGATRTADRLRHNPRLQRGHFTTPGNRTRPLRALITKRRSPALRTPARALAFDDDLSDEENAAQNTGVGQQSSSSRLPIFGQLLSASARAIGGSKESLNSLSSKSKHTGTTSHSEASVEPIVVHAATRFGSIRAAVSAVKRRMSIFGGQTNGAMNGVR